MNVTKVYDVDGRIAYIGPNKSIADTTVIDTDVFPIPADYHKNKKPYIWSFAGTAWVLDQDKLDKIADEKDAQEKEDKAKESALKEYRKLLNDPTTDWTDPTGDILKSLAELGVIILRKA